MQMNTRLLFAVASIALASLAFAAEQQEESAEPRPLSGDYQVYGGSLAEMRPPTTNDRNVSFEFSGKTARDLFNYIGPDMKKGDSCSDAQDYRERRRGDLHCVHTKKEGYSCYLGLNLRTGKSEVGSIC